MKLLLTLCAIVTIPAFGGDPNHLLPATPVTIHATMNSYDAYFAVSKILKVQMVYVAELKSIPVKLDLDKATGAKAFDTITAVTHKPWETRPDLSRPGQVLVIVSDPQPQ